VLDGSQDEPEVVKSGLRKAPVGLDRPAVLQWLRREVQEILTSFEPQCAFFKATETNSRNKDMDRAQFEGVLMEAALSHRLQLSVVGRVKSQVRHDTGFERPARYVQELAEQGPAAQFTSPNERDAYLAALCGLHDNP